ncbi:hypothetical protein EDC04DRAFT_2191230 [Pisolithus marmoratus]|nr:hypothetical protein EDC04DRAFT_2191230 [Pisolithus marmoratus]
MTPTPNSFNSSSTGNSHSISSSHLCSSSTYHPRNRSPWREGCRCTCDSHQICRRSSRRPLPGSGDTIMLYITVDTKEWAKPEFPHASPARLCENAYTIVESTAHSVTVNVLSQDQGTIDTPFNSNGTSRYLMRIGIPLGMSIIRTCTNGVEGVGIANVVSNPLDVERKGQPKKLRAVICLNDGSSWTVLHAPSRDGNDVSCYPTKEESSVLHLYSVTNLYNFSQVFSFPAPGFVIGAGSIGRQLANMRIVTRRYWSNGPIRCAYKRIRRFWEYHFTRG